MDYLINPIKTLASQLEGKMKSFNKEQRFKHLKKKVEERIFVKHSKYIYFFTSKPSWNPSKTTMNKVNFQKDERRQ